MRASTSTILNLKGDIHKRIIKYKEYHVYEREVFWLKKFKDVSFTPKLLSFDDNQSLIIMEYVGENVNSKTNNKIPIDFKVQIDNIYETLKEHNCQHNDINHENILIKDNKIYLIDFGWSTFINDELENKNDRYYPFVSYKNFSNFPWELNLYYKNKGVLDENYSFELLKRKINEIRGNI